MADTPQTPDAPNSEADPADQVGTPSDGNIDFTTNPPTHTAPVESPETDEFDPVAYEQSYGLPAGTLGDCDTEAKALEVIRNSADTILLAGLQKSRELAHLQKSRELAQVAQTTPEDPVPENSSQSDGEASALKQLEQKVQQLEKHLQARDTLQEQTVLSGIERRVAAEIDSWDSDMYGKSGGKRTYDQTMAVERLRQAAHTFAMGQVVQNAWDDSSGVEIALRNARAFSGDSVTKKKKAADKAQLGSPSGSEASNGAPANIHAAVMSQRRFW